jgi:hypothetical protein
MASPLSGSPEPRSGGDRIHDHETKPENPLEKLDPSRQADEVQEFALALKGKIVGQEQAVQSLV